MDRMPGTVIASTKALDRPYGNLNFVLCCDMLSPLVLLLPLRTTLTSDLSDLPLTFDRPCCHPQEEIYLTRVAELDAITSQRDTQRKYYDDLRKQRLNEFMAGFAIITSKLKGMCGTLTHDILDVI